MKKSSLKKNFKKFSAKNTHKRRDKERSVRELARALEAVNMSAQGVKFKDALDEGRRARRASKPARDEVCVQGVFSSSKSGYGFVRPEQGDCADIFIPEDKCGGAIDGDLVEIIYHTYEKYGQTRTEGRVRKILQYGRDTFIGTAVYGTVSRKNRYRGCCMTFIPDDSRVLVRPYIIDALGAREGDKVEVEIDRTSHSSYAPDCRVIKVFGDAESKEANYAAILSMTGIEVDFHPDALAEAEAVAREPICYDGRSDKTDEIIFTIDGADAKDLDDAISLRRSGDGWILGVHIADVSHYVREKTALDRAAMSRGTSVYFTDKVVPMLPTSLSNGACSLNAGEPKYAISATVKLSKDAEIEALTLEPSVIKSRVRGVYSEVNELLGGTASEQLCEKYSEVKSTLDLMLGLYTVLKAKSERRGALDFDAEEARILLDAQGRPTDIVKRERGTSERIIEQFMLLANEAVAKELTARGIPCVYRVHAEPPADKFSSFVDYAHNLGFNTESISKDGTSALKLCALLREAQERDILYPVSYSMLRAMSKAEYSKTLGAHFGLSLSHYCHFTSPIRRLADLATHRIIRRVLFEGKRPEAYASYAGRAAAAATEAELRALDAERRIENLYKVIYMSDMIGEELDARICSVTSFGMFCALENTCEGLIPISALPGVFFFDEKNMSMRSKDTVYKLGDPIRVRLTEADIAEGKLSFEPV